MIEDLIRNDDITLNSHDFVQAVLAFWTPYWEPQRALRPEWASVLERETSDTNN